MSDFKKFNQDLAHSCQISESINQISQCDAATNFLYGSLSQKKIKPLFPFDTLTAYN